MLQCDHDRYVAHATSTFGASNLWLATSAYISEMNNRLNVWDVSSHCVVGIGFSPLLTFNVDWQRPRKVAGSRRPITVCRLSELPPRHQVFGHSD